MRKSISIFILFTAFYSFGQTNIAPLATVTANNCSTGPCSAFNDLNFGTCGTQLVWISTATPPSTVVGINFIQWDFPTPRAINQFVIHHAQNTSRFLTGATIQTWNGSVWTTVGTFSNLPMNCINSVSLTTTVTNSIRFTSFLMQGIGQLSNPNFREIEIFGPSHNFDAGVLLITNPEICTAAQRIDATIINYGLRRLDSLRLNWSINGVLQPILYLNTSLTTGNSTAVNLANPFNFAPSTNYRIEAWTSFPNGNAVDSGALNDRFIRNIEFLGNPNPPTIVNTTQCGQGFAQLMATPDNNGDSILWYNNATGGNPFAIGKNAQGPFLTSTSTFFGSASKISQRRYRLDNSSFSAGFSVTQNNDYGAMFNVTVSRDIVMDSMFFKLWYATPTNPGFQLYYKLGTYAGFQTNVNAWTKVSEGIGTFVNTGSGNMARVSANQLFLPAGVYSFYFTFDINQGSGNSLNTLLAGTAVSNADLTLQNASSIIIGKFGSTSVTANYAIAMIASYRSQCVNTTRLPYTITVKPRPIGADAVKASPFLGQFNLGVPSNPDVAEIGKQITYELTPPNGFSNAGHGATWIINSVVARTKFNIIVPNTDYVVTPPAGSANGKLEFTPILKWSDSLITFSLNYSDLGPHFCDSTVRRTVYVAPTPFANFKFPNVVCQGEEFIIENLSSIHSGLMTYKWNFGNGDTSDFNVPVYTYNTFGCYDLKLTATSVKWNVTKDTTIRVCIGEIPNTNFTSMNACEGKNLRFANKTTIGSGILTYKWDFGDNSAPLNVSNNNDITKLYANYGVYRVTLTATSNGCSKAMVRNAYQYEVPKPNFNVLAGQCSNELFSFSNATIFNSGNYGVKYDFIDGGNITTDKNPFYDFINAGIKPIKLIATSEFNCSDSITKNILVKQAPESNFTFNETCENSPTQFSNITNLFGESLINYEWDFSGSMSSVNSPIITWTSIGQRNVSLTTKTNNGCMDKITKTINVKYKPKSDFDFENQCVGKEAIFTNLTTYRNGTVEYKWFFGDGNSSNTQSPLHIFQNGQTYSVKLVSSIIDGCSDSITKTIDIAQLPAACNFNITRDWSKGKNSFILQPIGVSNGVSFNWQMGDGNIITSNNAGINYTFNGDIRYCVNMIARNQAGCECTQTKCIDIANEVSVLNKNLFTIYPNPSNGNFNIVFENKVSLPKINVYNAFGQVVYSFISINDLSDYQLDLTHLAKGIYSIKITTKDGFTANQNVIKQ